MRSLGIVTRENESTQWGGDLKALYTLRDGLNEIGYEATTTPDINTALRSDMVFLSNSCLDLTKYYPPLKASGKPFGVIAFHEDRKLYAGMSEWYPQHIRSLINRGKLDTLTKPEYKQGEPILNANSKLINECRVIIVNSHQEHETLKRDYPDAKGHVIRWTPGFADEWTNDCDGKFCEKYDLNPGEYLLQVGRIETRKNTIGTILATQDIDMPLVLIATKGEQRRYREIAVECISRRKGRTIIVSDYLQSQSTGRITVHNTREAFGGKLPSDYLKSAFYNAAVNVHPAFYELPGYTYLEAAAVDTPSVAGEWCSIGEYGLGDLIRSCCSYDVESIKQATLHLLKNPPSTKSIDIEFLKRTKSDVAKDLIKLL